MKDILNLYKESGETPLERLERFRKDNPEYKNIPLSYAGRLDPMAEGVLLVLVGEKNKEREAFLSLTKEYTVDVLFGFATDTYDLLGVVSDSVSRASHRSIHVPTLLDAIAQWQGVRTQKYPPFSSKPLEGVPLFVHARKGDIHDHFVLPEHTIEIFSTELIGVKKIRTEQLLEEIQKMVGLVHGDFRQERILTVWGNTLRVLYGMSFEVATLHVSCSSGTYVRVLAQELGEAMGMSALAMHIVRMKVGKYTTKSALR